MFGSDDRVWPAAIGLAIAPVRRAPFLTDLILHDNAARFLQIDG